jgi:hypothetical protein
MIDLTTIDQETLIARGQYSTIRGAHEDEKKRLAILCGQFSAVSSQVLRCMQPSNDDQPDMAAVRELLETGRAALASIEQCVADIESLASQRAALKGSAWGRK